jgi:aldehyde:ferredoxin oxidoreductase
MSNLYGGTILFINLGERKITREPTSSYARAFLGGRGINIRLLYENIAPGADPLGPDNVFVIGVGPLGGTSIGTGRTEFTAKSPETGLLGGSNFGGYFAGELKYAGYDNVVITGKADKPVYLWICDDEVEIRDASAVWGKDAYEAPELIREEVGNPDAKIACIGPAGENLVRFATIQHELGHGAGRTGMGAVMGSKNLKAIAVRGTKGIKLADPKKFLAISKELEQAMKEEPYLKVWAKEGLSKLMDDIAAGQGEWGKSFPKLMDPKKVPSVHAMYKKHKPKRAGCFGCPVQCMDHYQTEEIGSGAISCEIYPAFTYIVGCFDTDTSLECSVLCQKYGVDCDTSSSIIRWLMILHENGIISEEDTDGIPMKWGSPKAIRSMLDKIVFREGIGDILAEGMLPAAREIGRGAEEYALHVKGIPMFEGGTPEWLPYFKAGCLSNAVGPRGDSSRACVGTTEIMYMQHEKTSKEAAELTRQYAKAITGTEKTADPGYEGKPELVIYFEGITLLCDLLSTCKYLSMWNNVVALTPEYQAKLFSAGSGIETSVEDLFEFANKVRTMERAYEAGEGLTREQETLPRKFFDNPIREGDLKGAVLEPDKFEEMKDHYYALRDWDVATGIPTEATLGRFGLDDVAEDLKKRGRLPSSSQAGQGT